MWHPNKITEYFLPISHLFPASPMMIPFVHPFHHFFSLLLSVTPFFLLWMTFSLESQHDHRSVGVHDGVLQSLWRWWRVCCMCGMSQSSCSSDWDNLEERVSERECRKRMWRFQSTIKESKTFQTTLPTDNPTVPKADDTSKQMARKGLSMFIEGLPGDSIKVMMMTAR